MRKKISLQEEQIKLRDMSVTTLFCKLKRIILSYYNTRIDCPHSPHLLYNSQRPIILLLVQITMTHMSLFHALNFHCILDCFTVSKWRWIRNEMTLQLTQQKKCIIMPSIMLSQSSSSEVYFKSPEAGSLHTEV